MSMASTEAPGSRAEEKASPSPPPRRNGGSTVADVVLRFLLSVSCVVAVSVMVTSKQTELVPIPFPPFLVSRDAKFNHSPAFIYFVAALSVAGLYAIITTLVSFFALLKPGCYRKVVSHFVIFDVRRNFSGDFSLTSFTDAGDGSRPIVDAAARKKNDRRHRRPSVGGGPFFRPVAGGRRKLFLGIMAAATGAAGAVAYIGLKGNSHVQWRKICDLYDGFCKHIGSSIAVSLFGTVVLALLIIISVRSLSKIIPK